MAVPAGAFLSWFGKKGTKEPTKGVPELPLGTPFPLEPPGPVIARRKKYGSCVMWKMENIF